MYAEFAPAESNPTRKVDASLEKVERNVLSTGRFMELGGHFLSARTEQQKNAYGYIYHRLGTLLKKILTAML